MVCQAGGVEDAKSIRPTGRARPAAPVIAVALVGLGVACLVAKVLVDDQRPSEDCGTSLTMLLDRLVLAAAALSVLAFLVGAFAILRGHGRAVAAFATVCGAVVTVLVLTPGGWGSYTCGTMTP